MKVVMIVDKALPVGLIGNAAAVLGVSVGKEHCGIVGEDVVDRDGNVHRGITTKAIPVLGATKTQVKEVRKKLFEKDFASVNVVDFSGIAQRSTDYDDYGKTLQRAAEEEIEYLGICLVGPSKLVNKLTGNLPLLR